MRRRGRRVAMLLFAFSPSGLLAACVDLGSLAGGADGGAGDASGADGVVTTMSDSAVDSGTDGGLAGDGGGKIDSGTSTLGCNGVAACERVMFVTHDTHPAAFGGILAADGICQNTANTSASMRIKGRKFVAWLSIAGDSASGRLVHGTAHYVRPDGFLVGVTWSDLVDGLLASNPNIDEDGQRITGLVWTGTMKDGFSSTQDCEAWLGTNPGDNGIVGDLSAMGSGWTEAAAVSCTGLNHLYCVEY